MQQLVNEGKIKARTKWKSIYPTFQNDERYLGMLGNPGSNPLELFWDVVDDLDQKLDQKLGVVNDVIKKHNSKVQSEGADVDDMKIDEGDAKPFSVVPETTKEQFMAFVKGQTDEALKKMSEDDLNDVFQNVSYTALALTMTR